MIETTKISPAVYITENDNSYTQPGVGSIGAGFIGTTAKGPAFIPTQVNTISEFERKFGTDYVNSYTGYSVRNYLENANVATIIRVLTNEDYSSIVIPVLTMHYTSSSTNINEIVAVFHPVSKTSTDYYVNFDSTKTTGSLISDIKTSGSIFSFKLTGSYGTTGNFSSSVTASLNSSDPNYVGKIFSSNPFVSDAYTYPVYNLVTFNQRIVELRSIINAGNGSGSLTLDNISIPATSLDAYSEASTPYVISQTLPDSSSIQLFKFYTIDQGNYVNTAIKIGITNIKEGVNNGYGTFTVVVRDYNDTDKQPSIIESFDVDLNPDSVNYIGTRIGTRYGTYSPTTGKITYTGDYPNKSEYIRVEIDSIVENKGIDVSILPFGFNQALQPLKSVNSTYIFPTASLNLIQEYNSLYSSRAYYGFSYEKLDNINYLSPFTTMTGVTVGNNIVFHLDKLYTHPSSSTPNLSLTASTCPSTARKFMLPLQGGYDGLNPAKSKKIGLNSMAGNTFGFDFTNSTSSGSVAYKQAIDIFSNDDEYDINMLVMPGILQGYHNYVINSAIDMVEERGDCFFVFDTGLPNSTVDTVVSNNESFDSNYSATYYPWIKITNPITGKNIWAPPTTVIPGVISFNDKIGYEWNAPAGLNRGSLTYVIEPYFKLYKSERDTLYAGRINAIAKFPNLGIAVWGQKTTQIKASALDRINVRRLLINIKKNIATIGKQILFEQNTSNTRNIFLSKVVPILDNIQQKNGLYGYKIQMDDVNNTSDIIDRNQLKGELWIQPTKTAEYVLFQINITPTGTTFTQQ
ncbi:MAG: phage tail sheath subtilisin-like domain-containing protein [Candidatus Omnitrophica bacterium]|jgi:hypothetical protein|nr:phage tail sheath subtilisin-like domain-containing protein [Candidatus Omnitrophota bacterium]